MTRIVCIAAALFLGLTASPTAARAQQPTAAEPPQAATTDARQALTPDTFAGETVADVRAPTASGTIPFAFEPGVQLFGEYRLTLPKGADYFHELDIPRAWAWMSFRASDVVGRVLLEATRAGGEGALIGVGGDSLVLRLREAWVGYRIAEVVELRIGVVPLPTNAMLTTIWGHRALAPIGLRQVGLYVLIQPSDLGATARLDIPGEWGTVVAALTNGEGYAARELNRGKTFELAAQLHPLAPFRALRPLTLTLAFQNGSTGTGSARANRWVGGLAWADPRWGVGVESAWILGLEDRGDREGVLLEAWGRVEPLDVFPLLLAARFSYLRADTQAGATTSSLTTFTGAVGVRVAAPLRVFVAVDTRLADDAFASAVPGLERTNLRLIVEGNLAGRFEGNL